MTRAQRTRLLAALGAVAVAGAFAGLATSDRWLPASADPAPEVAQVTAAPTSLALGCAPGVLDPLDPDVGASAALAWTSTGPDSGGAARSVLEASADEASGGLQVPASVVVAGQGGGELRGLSLTPCAAASGDQWVAAGATTVGEDLVLVLANPGQTESTVTVSAIGATGAVADSQTHLVAPGQTITSLPAAWAPDQERPILRVQADGPGVVAWAQSSGLDGEVPIGATVAGSVRASRTLVVPGVAAGDGASLRVGVPGADPARVSVTVLDQDGAHELSGAQDVVIDASTAVDVDLAGLPEDTPSTLVVEADVPVVATADVTSDGEQWNAPGAGDGEADDEAEDSPVWQDRSAVVPSVALTSAELPGADALRDLIARQLDAEVVRPTTVPTDSGSGDITLQLVLANAGDADVEVAVSAQRADADAVGGTAQSGPDGQTFSVPAGATEVAEMPGSPSSLEATGDVHVAVVATAQTPTGPVRATWPLGAAGVSRQTSPVFVTP